jgi:hypothetical protein
MKSVLLALAAVLSFASPIAAQTSSPATVGSQSRLPVVRAAHRYAGCVVTHRAAEARALLAMDFRTRAYGRAMQRLYRARLDCNHVFEDVGGFRSSGLLVAGSLAEALLQRDLAGQPLAPRVAYDPARPVIQARNEGEVMAICVVRTGPAETSRLLATVPDSRDEYDALVAMSPVLSGCTPRGQARFTREALRAIIALAAYRLVTYSSAG